MYNKDVIDNLIKDILEGEGIESKQTLRKRIVKKYNLQLYTGRALYYCDDFAIRFCKSKEKKESVSNTVIGLRRVKVFDDKYPIIVCAVSKSKVYLRLINSTFINKVSHSSVDLTCEKIRGSINYPNIIREYDGIENVPENFEKLFLIHSNIGFEGNLSRIVQGTDTIEARGKRFEPSEEQREVILSAPQRVCDFFASETYMKLKEELDRKTHLAADDILLIETQYSDNGNLRGNLVEYFITSVNEKEKAELRKKIKNNEPIDEVNVAHGLGDYSVEKDGYSIETDIKSKEMERSSAPKGYHIDKFLEFLSKPESVYLIYIVLLQKDGKPLTKLTSVFQDQILSKIRIEKKSWSGRNARGTVQFDGDSLEYFIEDNDSRIEIEKSKCFLEKLIKLGDK